MLGVLRRTSHAAIAFALVVAAPVSAQGRATSIGIYGPPEWESPPHYVVKAVGQTWTLDASKMAVVLQFQTSEVATVTIRDLDDCSLVLRFDVQPRTSHAVEFAADGTATVKVGGGDGGFIGHDEPRSSACTRLPATDMVVASGLDASLLTAQDEAVRTLAFFATELVSWLRHMDRMIAGGQP
jgi:hypothetical protein